MQSFPTLPSGPGMDHAMFVSILVDIFSTDRKSLTIVAILAVEAIEVANNCESARASPTRNTSSVVRP
jgi:hypothetical protein